MPSLCTAVQQHGRAVLFMFRGMEQMEILYCTLFRLLLYRHTCGETDCGFQCPILPCPRRGQSKRGGVFGIPTHAHTTQTNTSPDPTLRPAPAHAWLGAVVSWVCFPPKSVAPPFPAHPTLVTAAPLVGVPLKRYIRWLKPNPGGRSRRRHCASVPVAAEEGHCQGYLNGRSVCERRQA